VGPVGPAPRPKLIRPPVRGTRNTAERQPLRRAPSPPGEAARPGDGCSPPKPATAAAPPGPHDRV